MPRRLNGRDLEEELLLEGLRDQQSKRRAREQSEALGLVERVAVLLVTVAGLVYALIHHPESQPYTAIGWAVGGGFALIYRWRR